MGKIIKDKYPELDEEDQEAVRQHAIAALTLTQKAKRIAWGGEGEEAETRQHRLGRRRAQVRHGRDASWTST